MNIFGDQTIKAGDLVAVVRDCCGTYLGSVFRVSHLAHVSPPTWFQCTFCRKEWSNITYAHTGSTVIGTFGRAPLWWLKKLDAPMEHETEKHDEEITA